MPDHLQPHDTVENREVRGFTWKQALWIICAVMTIEFTLLAIYFPTMGRIASVEATTSVQTLQLGQIRVEQDLMKVQIARLDAQVEALRQHHPDEPQMRFR